MKLKFNIILTPFLLFGVMLLIAFGAYLRGDTPRAGVYLLIGVVLLIWRLSRVFTVGKRSLAKLSDTIHLVPLENESWRKNPAATALIQPCLDLGFNDAGSFSVSEMPGVTVHLLLLPPGDIYSAVYEHPKVGSWINFIAQYSDGTSITYTNSNRAAELDQRPGHPVVHAGGLSAVELFERFKTEYKTENILRRTPNELPGVFEKAYADSMAWRKNKGISMKEVLKFDAQRQV